MARTIAQIQQSIVEAKNAEPTLAALSSPSRVAIWLLWTYVVAVCFWTLEQLFDHHLLEVKDIIATTVPHKVQWYATMARRFMYGYNLVEDQDFYDTEDLTEAEIEAALVVKYAAANEINKGVRIKVAGLIGGDLGMLPALQLAAFKAYMARVKDAGVRLYIDSANADSLKLQWTIYYNALVLDATGARLDGTDPTPVADAIDAFLKSQPFNGLFITTRLVDAVQNVEGVVIPHMVQAQARYGALPYTDVPVEYLPDAGYLRILSPADLQITYIAHAPI